MKKPYGLLLEATDYATIGAALDIGSGDYRDSEFLVTLGFSVTAIDPNAEPAPQGITLIKKSLQEIALQDNFYDLITAQFSLHLVPTHLKEIYSALKPAGIFVGNFFGIDNEKPKSTITRDDAAEKLSAFDILSFGEVYRKHENMKGDMRTWHLFEFIVKKP